MSTRTLSRRQFLKIGLLGLTSLALPARLAEAAEQPVAKAIFNIKAVRPPTVALTFDDGFANVAQLLDVCQEARIRLTLFPIGKVVEANPEVWKRALDEGHEIGCHTYSHPALGGQPYEVVVEELARFMEVADKHLGLTTVRYFRPPYGSGWSDLALQSAATHYGMTVVMWNGVNGMNRYPNPTWREVVSAFDEDARAGDIFLYHFQHQEVDALRSIVELCRERGWQVGTVSQLLEQSGWTPPPIADEDDFAPATLRLSGAQIRRW